MSKGKELVKLCKEFIDDHKISHAESIYQTDRVIVDAYEFIESICDIVGYAEVDYED